MPNYYSEPIDRHIVDELNRMVEEGEEAPRGERVTYQGDFLGINKVKRLSAEQYVQKKIEEQKKKEAKLKKEMYDMITDILKSIIDSKVNSAQKKHLVMKFKQHIMWFKEYGIKE